jgi:uncharacterized alpha-E superfamily protein
MPMLSRVADSLYWMSRYYERADNCARAIEATYGLMLSRAEVAQDQRWYRALPVLGLNEERDEDPQVAIGRLATELRNPSSIVSCIANARDNAAQVREEITSQMWEQLNRLYHATSRAQIDPEDATAVMRMVSLVRESSYGFYGATETTMNHGQGWRFVQLGKFIERACTVSMLLDAFFCTSEDVDDLDWVALLTSCSAFESYCRVFTADLQPDRIATFLLVHPEFPYSVRHAVERMDASLIAIMKDSDSRTRVRIERIIGRLRAALSFTPMTDLMAGSLHGFLHRVVDDCGALHLAVYDSYIDYSAEMAFES